MSLLTKIFGRTENQAADEPPSQKSCHHLSAVPHWDNPDDMGIEERASSYTCQSCMLSLDPEQYDLARTAEMDRLRTIAVAERSE